jgi:hypothetical protein
MVVSNNGTSTDFACDGMATFGNSYVKFVTNITITNPGSLTFKTCDSTGAAKMLFDSGNNLCFSAAGLSPSTAYPVYVVQGTSEWVVRVPFPSRVLGSETSITTDAQARLLQPAFIQCTRGAIRRDCRCK